MRMILSYFIFFLIISFFRINGEDCKINENIHAEGKMRPRAMIYKVKNETKIIQCFTKVPHDKLYFCLEKTSKENKALRVKKN